jgi:hypothetical protein
MMATKTQTSGRIVYAPLDSFTSNIDGVDMPFVRDQTRVSADWLDAHPEIRHLFEEIRVHYDVERATDEPEESRS